MYFSFNNKVRASNMKSIEEIKKEINYAIENKKIDGFIENDCLLISCPRGTFSFFSVIYLTIIFIVTVLLGMYLNIKSDYLKLITLFYMASIFLSIILFKDYLVYDYNHKQFYLISKFFKFTFLKGNYLNFQEILEVGINNTYDPKGVNNKSILEKINDEEYLDINFGLNMVYLNKKGKLKNLTAYIRDKNETKNKLAIDYLNNFCELVGNQLEIPCKICNKYQKLEVKKVDNLNTSLNIIDIDIKKEKSDRIKRNIKLWFLNTIVGSVVPLEIILIQHYGLKGSFYIWIEMFKRLFYEIIPSALGLK